MDLRFEQPLWIWLALAGVPLGVLGWVLFRAMSPGRRVTAVVVRAGLMGLLALLLAGASSVRTTRSVGVIVVADVSGSVQRYVPSLRWGDGVERSVSDSLALALRRIDEGRGNEDLLGVVASTGVARVAAMPTAARVGEREVWAGAGDGSDLAEGLRLARSLVPEEATGRVVLVSDGRETRGGVLAAAREARAGGVRVDVVPLSYHLTDEVIVESIDAPGVALRESLVTLRVSIRAGSRATGMLRLTREAAEVDLDPSAEGMGQRVALEPGMNVIPLRVKLPAGRVHRFVATFEPDVVEQSGVRAVYAGDSVLENNTGEALVTTPGRGAVLLVDGVGNGVAGEGSTLGALWSDAGLSVEVVPPGGIPSGLLDFERYDLVVLENVPAESVPEPTQEALKAYVRELGGGLLMIGGPASMAAGGWKGSSLEEILPVRMDLPQRLIVPETATVFVIDNSGSMRRSVLGSVRSQQEIANDAAALAIRSLDARDLVGVIAFNNRAEEIVPLAPNADRAEASERVRDIWPGGGTNAFPAIERARDMLRAHPDLKQRHVVVLSDGRSRKDEQLPGLCESLAKEGIRVSTIAVGDDASLETMAKMATLGQGTFYHALRPDMLPQIFLKAVRVARTPPIREEPFTPVVGDATSPLLAGLASMPELGGLALASVRAEPMIQNALLTTDGEPVLSHWSVGSGRVCAYTSDAHRWGGAWSQRDDFKGFWTRLGVFLARPTSESHGVRGEAKFEGSRLRVRVEALDDQARPRQGLAMPATIYAEGGEELPLSLGEIAPGIYEGEIALRERGSVVVLVRPTAEGVRWSPIVMGAVSSPGAEYASLSSDDGLMREVAAAGGGRLWTLDELTSARLFDREGIVARESWVSLQRVLLAWTLIVLLADIGTRRIAWDRWTSGRFRVRQSAAEAGGAVRTIDALRQRGGRVTTGELALGDSDAKNLAMAARDARREARLRAGPQAQSAEAATSSRSLDQPGQPTTSGPSADASPLRAAKRRAQERFDHDDPG